MESRDGLRGRPLQEQGQCCHGNWRHRGAWTRKGARRKRRELGGVLFDDLFYFEKKEARSTDAGQV